MSVPRRRLVPVIIEWLMGAALLSAFVLVVCVVLWEATKWTWGELHMLVSPSRRNRRKAERQAQAAAFAAQAERHNVWVVQERERYRRERVDYERRVAEYRAKHPVSGGSEARNAEQGGSTWAQAADRYGEAHTALREAWKGILREHGADCMEAVCIMPARRITAGSPGDAWDLAHDHTKGGAHHYLGPAHKECNQAEALARGVTWEDAPSLETLLKSVGYEGTAYDAAKSGEAITPRAQDEMPVPPQLHPAHPDYEPPF